MNLVEPFFERMNWRRDFRGKAAVIYGKQGTLLLVATLVFKALVLQGEI